MDPPRPSMAAPSIPTLALMTCCTPTFPSPFNQANWVLPVAGFFVGFATNYLALYVIFKPIYPINVFGMSIQARLPTGPSQLSGCGGCGGRTPSQPC